MLFENLVTSNKEKFFERVQQIADTLQIDANWLMAVMAIESSLDPKRVNATTKATGLIQFMPETAKELGTTTSALLNMTNLQQLEYVLKYLKRYKSKLNTFTDTYLAVFYPAACGKNDDYKVGGKSVAQANSIYDADGNGQLTKKEISDHINNWVYKKTGYRFPEVTVVAKKKSIS